MLKKFEVPVARQVFVIHEDDSATFVSSLMQNCFKPFKPAAAANFKL